VTSLQWGGRFATPPDAALLAFGSSLEDDLLLAPFDVACSLGHVEALVGGAIISREDGAVLVEALQTVAAEIADGRFAAFARASGAEDVHGAIDARVRALAGIAGERLHAGRSRNDQVATTLLMYVRDRAMRALRQAGKLASALAVRARIALDDGTLLAGCTHRQPAQPVLLAYVFVAWAEPFVRAAHRFAAVKAGAEASCPLGSAAFAGSNLPLDRARAAALLGFARPSRNGLDAIGNRDAALDLAHACVRSAIDASRIAEEIVAWCTPAYGYARLGDAASTGSSLLPQKRNPDPFELVRAHAAKLTGSYAGALATLCGLAPSYQRDLQETKSAVIGIVEEAHAVLDAFGGALATVTFDARTMERKALDGYTIATDLSDALIRAGVTARTAHALVGSVVALAESAGRAIDRGDLRVLADRSGIASLDAPLDAEASVVAKRTSGSTNPADVASQIASIQKEITALAGGTA
jgi:argininosuccinate lyase